MVNQHNCCMSHQYFPHNSGFCSLFQILYHIYYCMCAICYLWYSFLLIVYLCIVLIFSILMHFKLPSSVCMIWICLQDNNFSGMTNVLLVLMHHCCWYCSFVHIHTALLTWLLTFFYNFWLYSKYFDNTILRRHHHWCQCFRCKNHCCQSSKSFYQKIIKLFLLISFFFSYIGCFPNSLSQSW